MGKRKQFPSICTFKELLGNEAKHKTKSTPKQKQSNEDCTYVCFHFSMFSQNDQKWCSTFHFLLLSFHDLTFEFLFCSTTTPVKVREKSEVASFSTFHFSLFAPITDDLRLVLWTVF
jgi:hypothetical protein